MNLVELQSDFQHILLNTEIRGADWVADSIQGLSSGQRLSIYHNAYRIRLIDTLFDTFAHTAAYLGENQFRTLTADYVQSHTSTHTNIGLYGKEFPDHLAQQLPNDKEVAELAHMDWTLRRAFDGKNAKAITRHEVEQRSAKGEKIDIFAPVPTLSLSTQCYNTLEIWHSINEDKRPPAVEKLSTPAKILVWRKGHSPHFRSLSTIEAAAVTFLQSGYGFESIATTLCDLFPDVDIVTEFGMIIGRWLEDELLTEKSVSVL